MKRISVLYSCKHYREFETRNPPSVGDELYCVKCNTLVRAEDIVAEYHIRCQTLSCNFERHFGQAKLKAEITASKHHQRYPKHTIKMFKGDTLVHTWHRQDHDMTTTQTLDGKTVNDVNIEETYRF